MKSSIILKSLIIMISILLTNTHDHHSGNHDHHHHDNHHDHDHHHHHKDHHHHQQNYHHGHQSNEGEDRGKNNNHSKAKKNPQLKMIQNKPHLLQSLKLTPISVFFYGSVQTPEYQEFQSMQPLYNSQFYNSLPYQIQFYLVPAQKFNLTRPNPSLSIYRKINNGEWLFYKGIFEKNQMKKWVIRNTVDPLKQLTGQQIDSFFVDSKKGFILLQFGQFYLLKTKILLDQFCKNYDLMCGKVTHMNKAINMAIQLMRAQKQPGVPKLGYWNPKSQELQIYTKDPGQITENQLMQLYSGHQSVIPYEAQIDVAQMIHPQTEFIELNEHKQDLQL